MRVTLDDLVNITDPLDRAKAAQRFVTAANEQLDREFAVTFTYIGRAKSVMDVMQRMQDEDLEPERLTIMPNMGI